MFRKYGLIGILMILFVEINFFLKIQPFAGRYFIIVWLGYILIIDALIYKLRKRSLIMNNLQMLAGLFILSSIIWWIFELINLKVSSWNYDYITGVYALSNVVWKTIYFSTVLPAFFETYELIRCLHIFDKFRLHKKHDISKHLLRIMFWIGIITFALTLVLPKYFYPFIWLTFFFILDPVNYLHKKPSIVGHLKDGKLVIPLSLLFAGIICGFLWEFWNYWALHKWYYNIPFLGFFKLFEMPILGYLGYFPFALELYVMYWFLESLFTHKEHILED